MTRSTDPTPDGVSAGRLDRPRTRPDGQVCARWAWTEPTVWTDRMLTALEQGVQAALRHVLEPIFEREFAEHSYGFRPGRGCKDALRRVAALLKAGYRYVVDADLQSYFDTIPHAQLLARIRGKVADTHVLSLIESFLTQGVMDGLCEWTPERGSPQGAVISPLLSNVYLDPLDHRMAERGFQMVRYADDFVVLCRTRADAEAVLAVVRAWVADSGVTLHPERTRIVEVDVEGVDFLVFSGCSVSPESATHEIGRAHV